MKVDVYKSNVKSWTYLIVPADYDPRNITPAPEGVESVHLKWKNYETKNTILETEHVHEQLKNPGYFVFR